MIPERPILAAVGDDDSRTEVIATARALAQATRLPALFTHVAQISVSPPATALPIGAGVPAPVEIDFEQARREAEDDALEFLERHGIGREEACASVGYPAHEVRRVAAANRAEAVVVGTPPGGPLRSVVSGSATQSLANESEWPIVVARAGAGAQLESGPIVCGVDPADGRATQVADAAARFASMMLRKLVLIHAGDFRTGAQAVLSSEVLAQRSRRAALRELEPVAGGLPDGIDLQVVLADGPPVERIEALAEERGAALVVVGCRGRGALRSALAGSVSGELSRRSGRPVMIVPTGWSAR